MFAGTNDFHANLKGVLQGLNTGPVNKAKFEFLGMKLNTKTDQESRHYGRITLTTTEGKSGEIIKIQGNSGNDETSITPEQVILVRSLIGHQWSTTLPRPDLAKRLKDCLSSLKTRPHIGFVRKLNLISKSYKSRMQ